MVAEYLEPFLANFSFIAIPFFVYQMIWVGKGNLRHRHNHVILLIGLSVASLLCMMFPMRFANGFIYDLRYIPFILAILYGYSYTYIPLYLVIISYRYFMGGNGFYVTVIVMSFLIMLLPFIKKEFKQMSQTKKMIFTSFIAVAISIIITFLTHIISGVSIIFYHTSSVYFIVSQGIGIWLMTYLIEIMLENDQLHKDVIHSEKLNVVSELAASISHEVRNPLTVTKGFLQLLKAEDVTYEKRKSYVEISLMELERAEMIINDYLAMTKSQKEAMVTTDLSEDLTYVTNVIKPYSVIHNVEVYQSFHNQLTVTYDRNQFRQSLINILKNCIEAMPKGGILSIETSSTNGMITINIKDTGVGMTKEEIARLGTPYYTTKEKGTGLGMTVVYSAIYSMHGKIHVESEKGIGSLFTIQLPA